MNLSTTIKYCNVCMLCNSESSEAEQAEEGDEEDGGKDLADEKPLLKLKLAKKKKVCKYN